MRVEYASGLRRRWQLRGRLERKREGKDLMEYSCEESGRKWVKSKRVSLFEEGYFSDHLSFLNAVSFYGGDSILVLTRDYSSPTGLSLGGTVV